MEFACWFCGEGIERDDPAAVLITIENLWRWKSAWRKKNNPSQAIYAHSRCAGDRMRGATMNVEPNDFLEDDD
jgi:hypothetical protein